MDNIERVFYSIKEKFHWTPDTTAWRRQCERLQRGDYYASAKEIKAASANGMYYDDCDGFVELVRDGLLQEGIKSRAIFCLLPWLPVCEQGHLVAQAEDGRILDCRLPIPYWPEDTNYTLVSMSDYEDGKPWHRIIT